MKGGWTEGKEHKEMVIHRIKKVLTQWQVGLGKKCSEHTSTPQAGRRTSLDKGAFFDIRFKGLERDDRYI